MIEPVVPRSQSRTVGVDSTPIDNRSMRIFELATAAVALLAAVLLAVAR